MNKLFIIFLLLCDITIFMKIIWILLFTCIWTRWCWIYRLWLCYHLRKCNLIIRIIIFYIRFFICPIWWFLHFRKIRCRIFL